MPATGCIKSPAQILLFKPFRPTLVVSGCDPWQPIFAGRSNSNAILSLSQSSVSFWSKQTYIYRSSFYFHLSFTDWPSFRTISVDQSFAATSSLISVLSIFKFQSSSLVTSATVSFYVHLSLPRLLFPARPFSLKQCQPVSFGIRLRV